MDKVVLQSHGLSLVVARESHVAKFLEDLSDENKREFSELYESDPLVEVPKLFDFNQIAYVVVFREEILALTGIDENGVMWSLFSKKMKNNFLRFARATESLMDYYHKIHEYIVCHVWTENKEICQWLVFAGFIPVSMHKHPSSNLKLVEFVHCNSEENNLSSKSLRPVMH